MIAIAAIIDNRMSLRHLIVFLLLPSLQHSSWQVAGLSV
jgi:hypothetical protein